MDGSKASPIVYFNEKGEGPIEHVCKDGGPVDRIEAWLFREKCYGLSAEGAKAVERLIEDLR